MKKVPSKRKNSVLGTLTPNSQCLLAQFTKNHALKALWFSYAQHIDKLRNGKKSPITMKQSTNAISNPARKVFQNKCPNVKWDGHTLWCFAIDPHHELYDDDCLVKGGKMGSTKNRTQSYMVKCFKNLSVRGMYLEQWKYTENNHTLRFVGSKKIQ